jgi:hypothetical protein
MADSTTHLDQLTPATANNELRVNEGFDATSVASVFGRRASTSTGATWGYYGGRIGSTAIANGTLSLTTGTNYIVALRSTFAVSSSTSTTNWSNTAQYMRLYQVVVSGGQVTSYEDRRLGQYGVFATGPIERPVNSQSAAYTLVEADARQYIYHPSADTTARVWTIPANSAVGWPIGTELEFVNDNGAGVITIAITSDTMRLVGAGTTGSRTLAANGFAVARKMTATTWQIRGWGLT